jgi:sugar phosphate isomerase/epimerase
MARARICLIAVVLAACGDQAADDALAEDSGSSNTMQMDAPSVDPNPAEGGAGAGGSGSVTTMEGGRSSDVAVMTPDAKDSATGTTGPDRWVGTPFVMDTWFWSSSGPVADRVALVQQLGYQGLALSADHQVAEYVSEMRAKGLKMPGIWAPVDAAGYPTNLVKAITGTGGYIWLSLSSGTRPVSDAAGDDVALTLVQKLADECHAAGLPGVALYPHVGMWMERVGDAVRLAKKAARPDVGVVFNEYHWMVVEGGRDLAATLASALPYLKDVTINGSDAAPSILPLGQGAYDVASILRALSALDYRGSVGLQGYSITGDIPGKLQSSKQAWDQMIRVLPKDGG